MHIDIVIATTTILLAWVCCVLILVLVSERSVVISVIRVCGVAMLELQRLP